ncbi:hypothetical protein N752_06370 [Desulforamulus aquiferis]|nr:MurT ligase domain-containing protein [Desulforamulus aquiferis]RYD06024.1 hypothetical protein N752_06370 [Desulforamulus aquiferis]
MVGKAPPTWMIARRIYPGVLRDLAGQARQGVIMVTGTNGKTTTNNMIASVLQAAGFNIVINQEGANLITGVTTAFIKKATWYGRIDTDIALLEVDEASLPRVIKEVKPKIVVVNNFFRDQLDRYGELDTTVRLVKQALKSTKDVHLVLNADDPLVAQLQLGTGHKATFFGMAEQQRTEVGSKQTRESRFCPDCGMELVYDYYQYSQLGSYHCSGCGFKRPNPDVLAYDTDTLGIAVRCRVRYSEGDAVISINTQGYYNLYNALAAFAVGTLLKVDPETSLRGLAQYKPGIGRMEKFYYQEKPVFLNLVKNPTGFNEGLVTALNISGSKNVFMAINDNDADGRDISWLWDVDFEYLAEQHQRVNSFVCSGLRAEEMALRLKYSGIPTDKIKVVNDMEEAVRETLDGAGELAYLFSTYTALWPTQKILLGLAKKEDPVDVEGMPSVS